MLHYLPTADLKSTLYNFKLHIYYAPLRILSTATNYPSPTYKDNTPPHTQASNEYKFQSTIYLQILRDFSHGKHDFICACETHTKTL